MSDLPQAIDIFEEGPREGFQIEKAADQHHLSKAAIRKLSDE